MEQVPDWVWNEYVKIVQDPRFRIMGFTLSEIAQIRQRMQELNVTTVQEVLIHG